MNTVQKHATVLLLVSEELVWNKYVFLLSKATSFALRIFKINSKWVLVRPRARALRVSAILGSLASKIGPYAPLPVQLPCRSLHPLIKHLRTVLFLVRIGLPTDNVAHIRKLAGLMIICTFGTCTSTWWDNPSLGDKAKKQR